MPVEAMRRTVARTGTGSKPERSPAPGSAPGWTRAAVVEGYARLGSGREGMEATFCFVDIAGFTALTETHGGDAAADLVDRFMALVREALDGRGRVVDRAGDAVFVVAPAPDPALDFLVHLFEAASKEPDFPILRAGLHHGEAVEREGAYFGAAVNLAARIAAQAGGGEALATQEVSAAAASRGIPATSLGARRLRNVRAAVEIFSLELSGEQQAPTLDPVCRMRVDPERAAGRLRFDGRDHWFCSLDCAALFAATPEAYGGSGIGSEP